MFIQINDQSYFDMKILADIKRIDTVSGVMGGGVVITFENGPQMFIRHCTVSMFGELMSILREDIMNDDLVEDLVDDVVSCYIDPSVRSTELSTERSTERSAERSTELSTERSTECSTERSTERSTCRHVFKLPEKNAKRKFKLNK
jgi:hypothetical protein